MTPDYGIETEAGGCADTNIVIMQPDGTAAGTATLDLSVAWINGSEVKIPVR